MSKADKIDMALGKRSSIGQAHWPIRDQLEWIWNICWISSKCHKSVAVGNIQLHSQ